jgi:hypothetical protein
LSLRLGRAACTPTLSRKAIAALGAVCIAAVSASVSLGQPPPQYRFTGYVGGVGSGPGHAFVVGDGLNLAFRDDVASQTRYRVCWRRAPAEPHCWSRRTRRAGLVSKIFTPAPASVGVYVTRWYFRGRVVATWRFYNGPGD